MKTVKTRLLLAVMMVCGLLALAGAARADWSAPICKVVRVGGYMGSAGSLYVGLVHVETTKLWGETGQNWKWFEVKASPADRKKEMMALFLTALSTGKKIQVYTPDVTAGIPEVGYAYLLDESAN